MSTIQPDEPAAPPVMDPFLRDYNFEVLCASGTWQEFAFQATDFLAARKKLAELIGAN